MYLCFKKSPPQKKIPPAQKSPKKNFKKIPNKKFPGRKISPKTFLEKKFPKKIIPIFFSHWNTILEKKNLEINVNTNFCKILEKKTPVERKFF